MTVISIDHRVYCILYAVFVQ